MAGDWIPWSKGLLRKPEVIGIAKASGKSRREVVCVLMEFWEWADSETQDGFLPGVDVRDLSALIADSDANFWHEVVRAGWLLQRTDGLEIPNFGYWMGASAKRRLKEAKRKRRDRIGPQNVRKMSAAMRPEERRGEGIKKRKNTSVSCQPDPEAEKADTPPDQRPSETAVTPPAKKERPRDELFDAVAEVTASDPRTSGSHVGRVCKALRLSEPAYTPDEVRRWGKLVTEEWKLTSPPTLGMLEKHIGRVRAKHQAAESVSAKFDRIAKEMRENGKLV